MPAHIHREIKNTDTHINVHTDTPHTLRDAAYRYTLHPQTDSETHRDTDTHEYIHIYTHRET